VRQVPVRLVSATAIAVATAAVLSAQVTPDRVPATGGPITITPLNHATLELTWGKLVILVDPTPKARYDGLPKPTHILVTDIHGDHMDPKTIDAQKAASTVIVTPASVAKSVPGATVINNGETKTIEGLAVEAVPMYNLTRGPAAGQLFHDKGRGNGYVLTLGGKRIYIAGDTECTPEMKALKNIDVAFVPMNLPYTMPPDEAAACVKAFAPKIVYPYHYQGQDLQKFQDALKGSNIEVRIRDWYAAPKLPAPGQS
jgi:L-ascorbate metabolism protein UlaG (beta-lactamase superfamily)